MLSRYIDNFDFKSRFRILKGGKVSLVVSAILVSSSLMVTNVNALEVTGTTGYNNTIQGLTENTDFDIVDLDTSVAGTSAFVLNGGGYNTNIRVNSSTGEEGIKVNYDGDPKESLEGITLYNIGNTGSSITTTNNRLNVKNTTGIASKSQGTVDLDNITIDVVSDVVSNDIEQRHGIFVTGVGFAEGIYVQGDLKNSSITNDANSYFVISSGDPSQTVSTEAFGIDIGTKLINSTITNNGQFLINSNYGAYGIYVSDDTTDSQISNTGTISTSSTRTLTTELDDVLLSSTGIELNRVMSNTDGVETSVKNSNEITAESIATITADGQVESSHSIIANAKGVSINYLAGDIVAETTAEFENSGDITATSKLDFVLNNTGAEPYPDYNYGIMAQGDVYATATGLEIDTNRATVANTQTGTISALAQIDIDGNGIVYGSYMYAQANGIKSYSIEDTTLLSYGTIDAEAIFNGTTSSSATANGVYVDDEVLTSLIGLTDITAKATAHSTAESSGAYATASGFKAYNATESIIGIGGTVDVEASASSGTNSNANAYGVNIYEAVETTILNNNAEGLLGDIKVNAEAVNTSDDEAEAEAHGIYVNDFTDSTIQNMGNIEVTATANSIDESKAEARGISVYMDENDVAEITPSITNDGNILVNAKATVSDVEGEASAEAYGIIAYIDTEENLTIVNSENSVITALVNDKLDKDGYSLSIPEGGDGVITVTNSGTLRGNLEVEGTLTNSGTIELAHNAMDEDSAYISNFTNGEHGILRIGLLTKGSLENTTYSQLNTESATFENGSTLNVDVLNSSTNVGLLAGNKLENVITATDNLTINGTLSVTDNSALLNFNYVTNEEWTNGEDGAIHLNIISSQTVEEAVNTISPKITQYANAVGAAKALDNIIENVNEHPQMEPVISRLNQLPTNESVAKAVESTTPVATNATVGATTQISNGIAGIVSQRQNANISAGGINSGDGMFSENNLWIKPFGSIGSQNNKDGINGFDLKTYGLGFGADTEYKDNQKVGLAFFYTNGNVDVNNMNQNADLDVFTTLVYGNIPVFDDKTNFLYQAGYSWQKTATDREVFTSDIAESKYTSKTASLDLKLMRDINISKDLLLQPLVNTTYRHFTNPAYSETGADALNLNVDKFTSTDLIVGLGTQAHYKINQESKIIGNVNVGYDLHDKNQTITSAYEGATGVNFDTDGIDNGRWSYEAGIGYEKDLNKTSNINISYDYQGQGKDFSNNVISAKYVLKF